MLVITERTVRFAGEDSFASNLAPVDILVSWRQDRPEYVFTSVEAAYQAFKLSWLGVEALPWQPEALPAGSGKQQMFTARRKIQAHRTKLEQDGRTEELNQFTADEKRWRELYAERLLTDLHALKVKVSEKFRRLLTSHSDLSFMEATGDKFWGAGVPKHACESLSDDQFFSRMNGENRMGKLLDKLAVAITEGQEWLHHPDHKLLEECFNRFDHRNGGAADVATTSTTPRVVSANPQAAATRWNKRM